MSFISSLISIIILFMGSMNVYINTMSILQTLDDTLVLSCILMIILRKDNIGLHDLLSGTYVESIK